MPENNECQPIVIFPLGVACQVTNPSGSNSSNGTATLIITGGTPPYSITWENGNTSSVINNLSAGSYPATIIDYYGDFTANTTCVLTGPVIPEPTTTTTTLPIVTYDFCMVITYTEFNLSNHFNPNGIVNGKQSWISDDELYTIVWDNIDNRWEFVDTINNLTVINNNPAYPPLSGWIILGHNGTVTVNEGDCQNIGNLALKVTTNGVTCTECDASITIEGSGGTPPYQYSINGGITWFNNPIFQGLCPNVIYSPQIKDSTDLIVVSQSGNVTFQSNEITTYSIQLQKTNTIPLSTTSTQTNYNIVISPSLPNDGTTITFDMIFIKELVRTPNIDSASGSMVSEVKKNDIVITGVDTETSSTYPNTNIGCTSFLVYKTTYLHAYNTLTISANDTYTIKVITDYTLTCDDDCCSANMDGGSYYLNHCGINGCSCCNVILLNTNNQ
jgi:hypothetical protein